MERKYSLFFSTHKNLCRFQSNLFFFLFTRPADWDQTWQDYLKLGEWSGLEKLQILSTSDGLYKSVEIYCNQLILSQNQTTDSLQWFGFDWKLADIYWESVDFHWFKSV